MTGARWGARIAVYGRLAKPGIVLGNLVATLGGFMLASHGRIDWPVFALALCGSAAVVAGSGIFNNIIDRNIDAVMSRTRHRALVTGVADRRVAFVVAVLLCLAGLGLLGRIGPAPALLALFGIAVYVGLYSLWLKRQSVHGTLVGSLSGAVPPAIGYAAAGQVDFGMVLLMLLFCLWQMPHSYAIALLRAEDYAAVHIPLPPLRHGAAWARRHICYYLTALLLTAMLMTLSGYAGYGFLAVALLSGGYWLGLALWEYGETIAWARRQLLCSLITVVALSLSMAIRLPV